MHRSHYLIQYQCTIKSHTKTLLIQYSTVDTAYTSAALGFFQRCVYTSCINTPAALFCNYTPVASKPQLHFSSYPSCINTSAALFFIPQLTIPQMHYTQTTESYCQTAPIPEKTESYTPVASIPQLHFSSYLSCIFGLKFLLAARTDLQCHWQW